MDSKNGEDEPIKFTVAEFLLLFYLCEKELQEMPGAGDVVILRDKIKRLQLQQLAEDDQI